ncbi:uncharacterized protein HemY [Lysinibacillus composti]|uniref:Uncharacterized protein n=1 Tax=Lysinibacillus composti TaxID=720633 RepID=A0A3N9UJA5_9BACI|nr:hypothetical protein [Lysinibacillus composti]MBM7607382.1 uncharacterized protein HemY [Lysinibacillus composti]RQW76060.1 hypothetical protein EBB45_00455 [Lysinibacillus composti]
MLNYFIYLTATIFVLGVGLLILSVTGNVSIWYGIELIRGSVFVFMIGLFIDILDGEMKKRKARKTYEEIL